MTPWRATAALGRAVLIAGSGLVAAVLFGEPALVVLTVPLAMCAALGLWALPRAKPAVEIRLDRQVLYEGQGTVSRLLIRDDIDVEQVTRVSGQAPYVALLPARGAIGRLWNPSTGLEVEVGPRRWGRHWPAPEKVALTAGWAAWRWGPVSIVSSSIRVLPSSARFDSRAEIPQPVGLVGAHRSQRVGAGAEFSGIRPFHSGDRLGRIHWPTSLRTGELHVVATRAEEDGAILLVVDALSDHGRSEGVDGEASSLDLTVRGAAALAEHFGRTGDRVGLRVVGPGGMVVGFGAGVHHHRMILEALAETRPGSSSERRAERLRLPVDRGTIIIVLSPMLQETIVQLAATLVRRDLPVLVVDTLPPVASPAHRSRTRDDVADLAWRIRCLERETLLEGFAASCPVVPWRGPGTLDEVLLRLARRGSLPRVARR